MEVLIFFVCRKSLFLLSHPDVSSGVKLTLLFQVLDESVDALHLSGDVNSLRTLRGADIAIDAVVGLSQLRNRTVVSNKECATRFAIVWILRCQWHAPLVYALVEVQQYSGNV